jgi:hypothetical protein
MRVSIAVPAALNPKSPASPRFVGRSRWSQNVMCGLSPPMSKR